MGSRYLLTFKFILNGFLVIGQFGFYIKYANNFVSINLIESDM